MPNDAITDDYRSKLVQIAHFFWEFKKSCHYASRQTLGRWQKRGFKHLQSFCTFLLKFSFMFCQNWWWRPEQHTKNPTLSLWSSLPYNHSTNTQYNHSTNTQPSPPHTKKISFCTISGICVFTTLLLGCSHSGFFDQCCQIFLKIRFSEKWKSV